MTAGKFRLVALHQNEDTKLLCKKLTQLAEDGELVGSVVISMSTKKKGGKSFSLHLSGWASTNPTFAAGAMSSCLVLLHELALKESGLL